MPTAKKQLRVLADHRDENGIPALSLRRYHPETHEYMWTAVPITQEELRTQLHEPVRLAHEPKYWLYRNRFVSDEGIDSKRDEFVDALIEIMSPERGKHHVQIELRAYVISFCARADRALHWLHYGRSGTGAAIEFDAAAVRKSPFDLVKVIYDTAEQAALVDSVISATATCLEKHLPIVPEGERDELMKVAAHIAAARLRAVASLMKHPAYSAEEEWRLITHDVRGKRVNRDRLVQLPSGYRTVAGRIVPYQDLIFDRLPATGIVLGFSSAIAPNDPGLDELLKNTGMTLPITRSDVPVRP